MKKILINDNPWQTRIAITRNDNLETLYFKSPSERSLERTYFKGNVSKVLPGIQTAFVNIGQEKAGFLHISEIDRELAINRMSDSLGELEEIEARKPEVGRHQIDISKILNEGEDILVQVSKEPVYEKGAKLTTCFTIPGRFLVLMPNIPRIGISKKIEDREERNRLRDLVAKRLPEGMGVIIRTSSENQAEGAIAQDLAYLVETWEGIARRFKEAKSEEILYEDIPLELQVIRDNLDEDVEAVICDTQEMQTRIYKFIKQIAPEFTHRVKLYEGSTPLFEKYNLEKQIKNALEKKVHLKSGGSLIIESTEAMTVVDVNTGRYIGQKKLEDTILKTNMDAAEEVVRQLRLRNIGGLIVIDFIDMTVAAHRQKLYRFLEKELKEHDKFQSVVLKVSEFGLVQMTRKRSGKTLVQQMTETCQLCKGSGVIPSIQTEAFLILRALKDELERHDNIKEVVLTVHPSILQFITGHEYNAVLKLEKEFKCTVLLMSHEEDARNSFTITRS